MPVLISPVLLLVSTCVQIAPCIALNCPFSLSYFGFEATAGLKWEMLKELS